MAKASQLQEPPPPMLKRDGFEFCKGVFSTDSIDRVDGKRLHELFNPSTLRLKRDQKEAAQASDRLFTRHFFKAQLRYYGIPFRSSSQSEELRHLLQDAVQQGKCSQVSTSVLELEVSMRADYEPLQQEWEAECAAWRAEKKRENDEAFEKRKSPSERAKFDLGRFMDRYFLTNGEPDMTKTTEVLVLRGLRDNEWDFSQWKLHGMVMKVPGLHSRTAGYLPEDEEICIGWDLEKVLEVRQSIADRVDKAYKAERNALWEKQLEKHRKYVVSVPSAEIGNHNCNKLGVFNIDRCNGSYAVWCEEISDGWLDTLKGHAFTMDIWNGSESGTLLAAFDFGIIEGTMLLSPSEDKLQTITRQSSTDSEIYSSDEDDETGDGDDADQVLTTRKKRKPSESSQVEARPKRRKTTLFPSSSCRLYFRLCGRETGEGDIIYEPECGHIDFLGDGGVSFAGLVNHLSWVGSNVEFQGCKLSDTPRVKPEAWGALVFGKFGRVTVKT